MGCNCKNIRKMDNILNINNNSSIQDKKSIVDIVNGISINVINKIIVVLLMIILVPIVIVYLIFSYLFGGNLMIKIPKFLKKLIDKTKDNG